MSKDIRDKHRDTNKATHQTIGRLRQGEYRRTRTTIRHRMTGRRPGSCEVHIAVESAREQRTIVHDPGHKRERGVSVAYEREGVGRHGNGVE